MKSAQTDTFFCFVKNGYIRSTFFGMDPSLQTRFQNREFSLFQRIHRKLECLELFDRIDENLQMRQNLPPSFLAASEALDKQFQIVLPLFPFLHILLEDEKGKEGEKEDPG